MPTAAHGRSVRDVARTSIACPSQWELTLDNDQIAYVRIRHGRGTVGVGNTLDDAVEHGMSDEGYVLTLPKAMDGYCHPIQMRRIFPGVLRMNTLCT